MSSLAVFTHIFKPIGALISMFVISYLIYSLVSSFNALEKKKSRNNKLQITAIITFVTYILYNIGGVLGRWAFDVNDCSIRIPMVSILWNFARAALYFFLLTRGVVSFEGSSYAFKPIFIKVFEVFIVVVYIAYSLCHAATTNYIVFDEKDQVCRPSPVEGEKVIFGYTYPFLLVDFLIGVVICASYARKLWQLQHQIDETIDDQDRANEKVNFIRVARKQTKLAFVAYITSLLALYIMPATKFFSFPFLDALINTMCVYCTFSFDGPNKMYRICCECNGNKICLCMWCFCCWCCNVPPRVTIDAPPKDLQKVASNDPMSSEDDTTKQSGVDVVSGETTVDTTEDATATAPTITATPATAST
eukprot:861629_1